MERSVEALHCDLPPSQGRIVVQDAHECRDIGKKLSVVVPVYNEEKNVKRVVDDLERTLDVLHMRFEVILVDDGSSDETLVAAHSLQEEYPHVKVMSHITNQGKSAAMITGFRYAEGDYIILMDGDGQFLAKDIPRMIEKLEEGYDVVNGWGKKKEPIKKAIPSAIYNSVSRKLFSLDVHQFNLGFKAFRRETVEHLILRKDEHRYILPLLKEKGFTIAEVPVEYLPRLHGTSKYGVMRIPYGVMDMVSLKMEMILGERPFRLVGLVSLGLIFLGILLGLYTVYTWVAHEMSMWSFAFSVIFLLSGVNMLFIGYALEVAKCPRR